MASRCHCQAGSTQVDGWGETLAQCEKSELSPVGVQDGQQGQQAVEQVVVGHRLAQDLSALDAAGARITQSLHMDRERMWRQPCS
jgi:hypothetical protein